MGSRSNTRLCVALAVLAAALSLLAAAAQAKTLTGAWAPFNRCPVDSAPMLSATGESTVAVCVAIEGSNGTLAIGHVSIPLAETNVQFGSIITGKTFSVVSPPSGTLASAASQVPGGLQGVCAGQRGVIGGLCQLAASHGRLNQLSAQLESVEGASAFNLLGAFTTLFPVVSLPVRIHLINPLLGPDCAIGTAKEPIMLAPLNTTEPQQGGEFFEPNGTPAETGTLTRVDLHGANLTNATFAVPGAHGCGEVARFDKAIDTALGLPSPSGSNSFLLEDVSINLASFNSPEELVPNEGKDFAKDWHSAAAH